LFFCSRASQQAWLAEQKRGELNMSENNKKPKRVLFHLMKGLIYGSVIGMVFGSALYLSGFSSKPDCPVAFRPSNLGSFDFRRFRGSRDSGRIQRLA